MNGLSMNNQTDAFAAAGLGQGGLSGAAEDFTEEENAQMALVQEEEDGLKRKLYERQLEEQSQKEQKKQEGLK